MRINNQTFAAFLFLFLPAFPCLSADLMDAANGQEEKPFKPHWGGSLGLSFSGQPDDQGIGQVTGELSFTGTYDFTESGHFMSLGLSGSRQKVEGSVASSGTFTVSGGLGLDFFFPALSFQALRGESALKSYTAGLDLGFQFSDEWSAGLSLNGGLSNHQGNVTIATITRLVEIDSKSWGAGLSLSFIPWDFLALTLSAQQSSEITYQIQSLNNPFSLKVEQTVRTPSLSLGMDFTIQKDFTLSLTGQRGQEFDPAGSYYNPRTGETVDATMATEKFFWGYSIGVGYSFE